MTQHTPGPWKLRETTVQDHPQNATGTLISGPVENIIGEVWLGPSRPANARLIAKAPEMKDELRNFLCGFDRNDVPDKHETHPSRSGVFVFIPRSQATRVRALLRKIEEDTP